MKPSTKHFMLGLILVFFACQPNINPDHIQWKIYSGDNAGSRYSSLDQINKSNVRDLKPVWTYHTEDAYNGSTVQCNPIIIDDRIFIISAGLKVIALNAWTGRPIWTYAPFEDQRSSGNSRGITYWTDGKQERLFYVVGYFIVALDAADGSMINSFGKEGRVDLHDGLDEHARFTWVTATTPGIIFNDLLIMGSRVGEGPTPAAPGHIRAFDVRTGDLVWTFRTIPAPGDPEAKTWSAQTLQEMGGANSWGGFTLDQKRGMVFCGTGSAAYDHWGGNRVGANLFANCILALDATTGNRIWHYQVVHHDIWDYDIPCQPNLVQVEKEGKLIDAVAQPTKMGHLFVLDRDTGDPIFSVTEEPVPQSAIPGEFTWPTQPFPPASLRYGQQRFTISDVTDLSPDATKAVLQTLKGFTMGSIFLPPGTDPTITMPQFNGGTDWGGAAYDPNHRYLFVNCSNEAEYISMIPAIPETQITQYDFGHRLYRTLCNNCHGNRTPRSLGAPILADLQMLASTQSSDSILHIIKNGKGLMPAFTQFSETELSAILALFKKEGEDVVLDTESLGSNFESDIPWLGTGHEELKDPDGFPTNKRPWGTLTAIDLDQGSVSWQVPLGTYPELERRGHAPTGTFNMGGPIVTAGGLVFIAATMDERIRAFDKDSGETLWEFQMNAGGYATPSTFEVNGKQMVVIGAGGGGKPGTKSGDTYYCFGLE